MTAAAGSWRPPVGSALLAACNVVVFVVAGAAPYAERAEAGGEPDAPSVAELVADTVRHSSVPHVVVTVVFLVLFCPSLERRLGAVGLVSAYVVGGFLAGFAELLHWDAARPVAGAAGGTTTLLATAVAARWVTGRSARGPLLVVAAWFWVHWATAPGELPSLGLCAAVLLGLYVGRGADVGFSRRPAA